MDRFDGKVQTMGMSRRPRVAQTDAASREKSIFLAQNDVNEVPQHNLYVDPISDSALTSASDPGTSNRLGTTAVDMSTGNDSETAHSGCSVKAVHDIISRFDDQKRELVHSIGFGGLLEFPAIKATNRKFSAWLMSMVDTKNSCLALPNGSRLSFSSEDVNLVFGIPANGKKVNEAAQMDKAKKEKMRLQCWPLSGKDAQSIKAVEELINTKYLGNMTTEQENTFKVAFVVFVMSTLFVPGAKHDYVHVDYWGALSDPSRIQDYNWAAYVHKRLIASAAKYKADVEAGSRSPNITGCCLFLQVFYLDNMDMGSLSMNHNLRPRIACFTYDRIRAMITSDTRERLDARSTCFYGKSKIRRQDESCYTWAHTAAPHDIPPDRESQITLWHAVIAMATILRIPLEAAGPLFLAAAEFNNKSQMCNPRTGIECITVLLKIMEPFIRGFHYNFDLHQTEVLSAMDETVNLAEQLQHPSPAHEPSSTSEGCNCKKRSYTCGATNSASMSLPDMLTLSINNIGPSCSAGNKRSRLTTRTLTEDVLPDGSQASVVGVDYSVIKSMSRFYMFLRYVRERNRLDLNTTTVGAEGCHTSERNPEVRATDAAPSPWELGDVWGYNIHHMPATASNDHTSMNIPSHSLSRVVDYNPKYIEVMPAAAQDQRLGISELEMDMLDAIIRCFKRRDDMLYHDRGRARWRHFFESDILAAVLAEWFDIDNPCLRNQFIGSHLSYDIYNCTMLFFPVILHERWVCLAWNLKQNDIIVFDPACFNIPGFPRRGIYNRVAQMLKNVLSSVIPTLFSGWDHPWGEATVTPFHWRHGGMPCANRTGVLCAYFCGCFDGRALRPNIEKGDVERIAQALFAQVAEAHGERPGQL